MPEGHTIHRHAKQQRPLLVDRAIEASSPQGRFDTGAAMIDGRLLESIEPVGKHLFYHFADDAGIVHIHLGMYGKFRVAKRKDAAEPKPPRGAVRLRLVTDVACVDLNGPTACELLERPAYDTIKSRIGPDLLDPKADREAVWRRMAKSKAAIGAMLMDQSVVSGIGNIYRAELLYRAGIHPLTPAKALGRERFDTLWADAVSQLKIGVRIGKIVTTDPAEFGAKTHRQLTADRRFYVYRRDKCLRSGAKVERFTIAGRTCYACPAEQKRLDATRG
ncbi:MAG: DNA-formamidopyrimidine glycosylase family protein [Planctomycetota bacterium]